MYRYSLYTERAKGHQAEVDSEFRPKPTNFKSIITFLNMIERPKNNSHAIVPLRPAMPWLPGEGESGVEPIPSKGPWAHDAAVHMSAHAHGYLKTPMGCQQHT